MVVIDEMDELLAVGDSTRGLWLAGTPWRTMQRRVSFIENASAFRVEPQND